MKGAGDDASDDNSGEEKESGDGVTEDGDSGSTLELTRDDSGDDASGDDNSGEEESSGADGDSGSTLELARDDSPGGARKKSKKVSKHPKMKGAGDDASGDNSGEEESSGDDATEDGDGDSNDDGAKP